MIGKKDKGGKRTVAFLAALTGAAAIATPGLAQQAQPGPAQPDQTAQTTPAPAAEEEIVVTGSRIRRDAFSSPAPVEVITNEQSTLEGLTDTADILYNSTAVAGSGQINNFFNGFVVDGGPGVNTISLRGLGAIRTLVLLNGRRLNPAGTRGAVGAVDLNTIPASMIERIEILKDGASSIYGSDAVAGVINVITRDDLDGAILNFNGMGTFDGGGETLELDGSWGHQFDRGNITASFEYSRREELDIGDRSYLSCPQDYLFFPSNGPNGGPGDRADFLDNSGNPLCFNTLTNVVNRRTGGTRRFISTPGSLANATTGAPAGYTRVAMSFAQILAITPAGPNQFTDALEAYRQNLILTPTNDPRELNTDAISPVERFSLFVTGNYDLGANNELYTELMFNRRESSQEDWAQLFFNTFNGMRLHPNNPFPGLVADSTVIRPSNDSQQVDYYRAVFGLRGDLPFAGWNYDVFGQYGYSDASYTSQVVLTDRLLNALGLNSTGSTFVGFCNAAIGTGCTAFNPFDSSYVTGGGFPAGVGEYILSNETGTTTYEQTLFQGVIDGNLFTLPAGPVGVALGGEWRREEIDDTPSLNTQAGNLFGRTSAGRTAGSTTIYEFFGEARVPLLANLPLIEELTFEGSSRWTHDESYGSNSTYRLGLNWQITPEYRIRSTMGTSYRAPALFELFLANQTGFQNQANIDPCIEWGLSTDPILRAACDAEGIPDDYDGANPSALIVTGGGAGILRAETSEAWTLGFIWTPSNLDISIALDYFEIDVNDQVAQFGAANILAACYTGASPDFCTLFTRQLDPAQPALYAITQVNDSFVNLNSQTTRGLDLTARYEHEFSFGTLRADLQATWTFEDEFNLFGGEIVDFNGEVGEPDFVAQASLRFDRGDWTYFWDVDMVGKASDTEEFGGDIFGGRVTGQPYYYKQYSEFTAYHDMSIRYSADNWSVQVGIQNVFDEPPPAVSTGVTRIGNVQLTSQNDILGRRAFVALTRRW